MDSHLSLVSLLPHKLYNYGMSRNRPVPSIPPEDAAFARTLVIHEDDALIVFNKPSGLAVQTRGNRGPCLENLLPAFARSGWLSDSFVNNGLFGLEVLRPYQLFGLQGLDAVSHSVFWSMLVNIGCLVGISLFARQSLIERMQAAEFTNVYSIGRKVDND